MATESEAPPDAGASGATPFFFVEDLVADFGFVSFGVVFVFAFVFVAVSPLFGVFVLVRLCCMVAFACLAARLVNPSATPNGLPAKPDVLGLLYSCNCLKARGRDGTITTLEEETE